MKLLTDFLPIVLFFAAYWLNHDIFLATKVLIAATVILFAWTWIRHRKIDTMQWISLGICLLLGAATLIFHDDRFIIWKPTVMYWLMGGALMVSELAGRNGLKLLMGQQLELPAPVWRRLTLSWIAFFAGMGALNLFIAFHFDRDIWVNFKLFGGLGLMVLFVVGQSLFLSKYIEEKK